MNIDPNPALSEVREKIPNDNNWEQKLDSLPWFPAQFLKFFGATLCYNCTLIL